MPPPSTKDGPDVHARYADIVAGRGGNDYYGYYENLLGFVESEFRKL